MENDLINTTQKYYIFLEISTQTIIILEIFLKLVGVLWTLCYKNPIVWGYLRKSWKGLRAQGAERCIKDYTWQ